MSGRSVFSTVVIVLVAFVAPSVAQQTLGDLVASGGYDWIIGRWVAGTDEGPKVEFSFDWALDKHVVLNSLQMGDFKYQGLITLSPTDQEAIDQGADSRGGTWKGTWSPDGDGLVRKVEHMGPDGQTRKGEMVFGKVDADTITIAIYAVDSSGSRSSEPWNKLTYRRQQAKAAPISATAEAASRSTDYQKLGDVVSEGGYEWLIGKWVAGEGDRTYGLEYKPILNMHAAQTDVKIGDFKYMGIIMYVASRQEIVQIGVDSMGGAWKGTWEQDGSDALNKIEYTKPDGTTVKLQHVYVKINDDGLKVKQYDVGADGSRGSPSRDDLTFKRQKPAAQAK
jgi:hypothetical protein